MDEVILLENQLTPWRATTNATEGYPNGIWETVSGEDIDFEGAGLPVTNRDISVEPEGKISKNDLKLYCKTQILGVIDKIIEVETGFEFKIYKNKYYRQIADVYIYILKRVEIND